MQTNLQSQPQPTTKKHLHDIETENHLERPSDFIEIARRKKAEIKPGGQTSRVVVVFNHRTIGFSNHGNKPYPREYRHLLVKAFLAAGLLGMIIMVVAK